MTYNRAGQHSLKQPIPHTQMGDATDRGCSKQVIAEIWETAENIPKAFSSTRSCSTEGKQDVGCTVRGM